MIFITHELPLLRHVANRIAVMYAGEFVELGTTDHWPSCSRKVPAPSAPPTGSSAADAVAWALARFSTVTEKLVGAVPPMAVADTVLDFDELAETALNVVRLPRRLAGTATRYQESGAPPHTAAFRASSSHALPLRAHQGPRKTPSS